MYAVSQKHFCRCLKSGVRSRHVTRFPFGSNANSLLYPAAVPQTLPQHQRCESDTTCVSPTLDERSPIGAHKTNYRKTTPPYPRGCFIISDARLRGSPVHSLPAPWATFFSLSFPSLPWYLDPSLSVQRICSASN